MASTDGKRSAKATSPKAVPSTHYIAGAGAHPDELDPHADIVDANVLITTGSADLSVLDKFRLKLRLKADGWSPAAICFAALLLMVGCTLPIFAIAAIVDVAHLTGIPVLLSATGTYLATLGFCSLVAWWMFRSRI